MDKIKVLAWCDTPTCATGFGQVARNILSELYKTDKYDFSILGINHGGDYYDREKFPYIIDPATCLLSNDTDLHGRAKLCRKLQNERVDILFIINDTFLVQTVMKDILRVRKELPLDRQFTIIYYFPIDATPQKDWIEETVKIVDFPVVYTNYGKNQCYCVTDSIFPLDVIYHGTNKSDFFPLSDELTMEFRKGVFKEHSKDFIIINVNRNQQRKDLHRSLAAYAIFHKKVPGSFYFVNCQMNDIGGNIARIGEQYGLIMPDPGKDIGGDWTCPAPGTFSASQGYALNILNGLYNAADLLISSSLGEGWGLSCTEAMQCKTPVLFPRNTSLLEMIGENEERGFFCKSGEDDDHKICLGAMDNNIVRPIVNVLDMANRMEYIYYHYNEAVQKAEEAYKWVPSWEELMPQWKDVFDRAEYKTKELRGEL
jgi:D-inositol-3-phosphate glycosyltransferase